MADVVMNYLINDLKKSKKRADEIYNKLSKHQDIFQEFQHWIETGVFKNSVEIEGYTAERLSSETYLTPLGAFNYLIYLREQPQEAKEMLAMGLPIM